MLLKPTTKITILDDTVSEDAFGDPVDSYTAEAVNVPAHIWEDSVTVTEPSEGGAHTVHNIKALVNSTVSISQGKRIKDETDNKIYMVLHVKTQNSAIGVRMPQELELEIVR